MPYMTRKTQGYSLREYLQGASRWNCRSVWEIANRIRRSQDHQGMAGCPQSQPCREQVWSFSTATSHALTTSMDGGCPGFWTHPCHYWATLAEVRIPSSRPVTVSLAAVCDHCLLSSHPALTERAWPPLAYKPPLGSGGLHWDSPQGFGPSTVGSHRLGAAPGPWLTPAHKVSTYCSQKKGWRQKRLWQQLCTDGSHLSSVVMVISCSRAAIADNWHLQK